MNKNISSPSTNATTTIDDYGCLRSSQRLLIKEMLNFNQPLNATSTSSIWKVLIMDECAQSILAPIISVGELRGEGVTLYLPLTSSSSSSSSLKRDSIPEVPAIYLVEANQNNLEIIIKDVVKGLYLKYYINFIGTLPRHLLEYFAQGLLGHHSTVSFLPQVQSIFDQYISFICLDRSLWILPRLDKTIEYKVLSIFSSILAMYWLPTDSGSGVDDLITSQFTGPPFIVYPIGMEELAHHLREKIKGHLLNTKYSFKKERKRSARPLLVLQERGFDLSAPLLMPMTYHSLVHDLLNNNLNRVEVSGKVMDLDHSDPLWRDWGPLAFPDVAAKVDLALSSYKEDMSKVMKSGGGSSGGGGGGLTASTSLDSEMSPEELRTAVTRLPELAERKKLIDNHLQLCTLILEHIKKDSLGDLFPFIGQGGIMAPSGTMTHLENSHSRDKFFSLLNGSSSSFHNRLRLWSLAWICLPINHQNSISTNNSNLLSNIEKWLEDKCLSSLRDHCPSDLIGEFEETIDNLKKYRQSLKKISSSSPSYESDFGSLTPSSTSQSQSPSMSSDQSSTSTYSKGNVIKGALFQGVENLMASVGDSVALSGAFGGAWGGGSSWNNGLGDDDVVGMGRSLPLLRYIQHSILKWRSFDKSPLLIIDSTGRDDLIGEDELDPIALPPALLLYMDGGVTWGEWDQLSQWSKHQLSKVQQKFGTTKISSSSHRHQWFTLGSTKMIRGETFLKDFFNDK